MLQCYFYWKFDYSIMMASNLYFVTLRFWIFLLINLGLNYFFVSKPLYTRREWFRRVLVLLIEIQLLSTVFFTAPKYEQQNQIIPLGFSSQLDPRIYYLYELCKLEKNYMRFNPELFLF